jgi:hypothetical protein
MIAVLALGLSTTGIFIETATRSLAFRLLGAFVLLKHLANELLVFLLVAVDLTTALEVLSHLVGSLLATMQFS